MRPLNGIKVIEMAGLAPSPYCGMLLVDFGADVVVIERLAKMAPEMPNKMAKNPFDRGKRFMRVDLKTDQGIEIVKKMVATADVLIEPYRPNVMEKLQLGPEVLLRLNPKLIYLRLTGWGQHGPYASRAGHDINYLALAGVLSLFHRQGGRPLPPCNLLGDFAGGGMLGALGILLALLERYSSGKGQVIDAAMLDGVVNLSTYFYGLLANNLMTLDIGTNLLDGGPHFYQTYETADGKFVAVGALEERFYGELLQGLEIDPASLPPQSDQEQWPKMKEHFAKIFKTKTRDQWETIFKGKDACATPVLDLGEVQAHPHNRVRELLLTIGGVAQPAPAPRLSRTPGRATAATRPKSGNTREILSDLGYAQEEIESFFARGIVE